MQIIVLNIILLSNVAESCNKKNGTGVSLDKDIRVAHRVKYILMKRVYLYFSSGRARYEPLRDARELLATADNEDHDQTCAVAQACHGLRCAPILSRPYS